MAEYIERKRAIVDACNSLELYPSEYAKLEDALNKIPAADVAPVRHGRWEETDWREYDAQSCETIRYQKAAIVCTNCRCAFKKDALWKRNFCPSCGAKMDGGKRK